MRRPEIICLGKGEAFGQNYKIRHVMCALLLIAICSTRSFSQSWERYKKLPDTLYKSQNLGYGKLLSIVVPKEYQRRSNKTFPLIIIFDSQNQRSYGYMRNTIDYLTSNEQMPASIIIGVESAMQKRFKETDLPESNPSSLGYKNEKFVFDELVPLAKKLYNASDFLLLVGHSRNGYFSTFLLTRQTERLNAVISISPFYNQENVNLVDSLASVYKHKQLNHRVYYIYSAGADFPGDFSRMSNLTRVAKTAGANIESKGYFFPEADHNVTPGLTIGPGLYEIFKFWRQEQEEFLSPKNADLKQKEAGEKAVSRHYGTAIPFSIGYLNGKGWQFFNDKKYKEAIDAWNILLNEYPSFSEGYLAIIQAQRALGIRSEALEDLFRRNLDQSDFYSNERKLQLLIELEAEE